MTRLLPALLLLAALPSLGCASKARVRSQQTELDQLKSQLATMQREQLAAREQNESLRNQMFVLHDRVESARTALARTQQAPPKLEVVKLSPTPSADPLAARVKTVRVAPAPVAADPVDAEGYDPSADEAEMFSYGDDEAVGSGTAIELTPPTAPSGKPARVASVKPGPAAPLEAIPEALAKTSTARPKEDPMKQYQRAFALFQAKNWNDASLAFQDFVQTHPTHEYADNAYYWMGECYYTQGEYALAIGEFQKIPDLYPGGNKVPDALLKIGISYQGLDNKKNAEKTLRQLVDAYPQSTAAELGRQRLAKIAQQ